MGAEVADLWDAGRVRGAGTGEELHNCDSTIVERSDEGVRAGLDVKVADEKDRDRAYGARGSMSGQDTFA